MQLWSVAHFHPYFWVGLLLHPPKSEDGNGQLTSYEIHTLNYSTKSLSANFTSFIEKLVHSYFGHYVL
jgi:hypothetical protein